MLKTIPLLKRLFLLLVLSIPIVPAHAHKEDLTHTIANVFEEMMQFIASVSHPNFKKSVLEGFKKKFKMKFTSLLKERFTVEEQEQINGALHKAGGKKIIKMAKVMLETFVSKLDPKNKLEDIQLTLSPKSEATLEEMCAKKHVFENLKDLYLKYTKEKNIKRSLDDANNFAKIAIKHLKKSISDNFSEEEYCSWYLFEKSELGKRLQSVLMECFALTFSSHN